MNQRFKLQKEIVRQLRAVLQVAEPHEKYSIGKMLRRNQIRMALLALQHDLERRATGAFDRRLSARLDAVTLLLEL